MEKKFDWTKFIIGVLSALIGALTASAAVGINYSNFANL